MCVCVFIIILCIVFKYIPVMRYIFTIICTLEVFGSLAPMGYVYLWDRHRRRRHRLSAGKEPRAEGGESDRRRHCKSVSTFETRRRSCTNSRLYTDDDLLKDITLIDNNIYCIILIIDIVKIVIPVYRDVHSSCK